MFNHLIEYEIFDHPQLLELFTNYIIDKEANLIMTLDQIEQDYCGGNFNNNYLLKLMLIKFAFGGSSVDEQMIKRGWIIDKDIDYSCEEHDFAIALHHIYSKKEERGDEIDGVESLLSWYLSQSTIKFFHDNKLEFRVNYSFNLAWFLQRLEYIEGLPKEISIDKIIKFKDGKVFKWNKATFVDYLTKEKEKYDPSKERGISPEEYQRFMKLVE